MALTSNGKTGRRGSKTPAANVGEGIASSLEAVDAQTAKTDPLNLTTLRNALGEPQPVQYRPFIAT